MTESKVIASVLLVVGMVLLVLGIWRSRSRARQRRAALELKEGNKIYNEWRRSRNHTLD